MFSTCKRFVINETFEPVWVLSPNASYWIYSLSAPQRVTVQCQETGSLPNFMLNSQMQLEGTGMLPKSSSCYVYADEGLKLLPHSIGRTTLTLTKAHVVLSTIENVLKFSEEVMLQPIAASSVNLQRLDAVASRVASRSHLKRADVTRIIDMLQEDDTSGLPKSWLWLTGVIVISVTVGSLWPVWLKLF
jgi:hypothetical protein